MDNVGGESASGVGGESAVGVVGGESAAGVAGVGGEEAGGEAVAEAVLDDRLKEKFGEIEEWKKERKSYLENEIHRLQEELKDVDEVADVRRSKAKVVFDVGCQMNKDTVARNLAKNLVPQRKQRNCCFWV